eukprot:TRINITY_DN7297_c0_g1_i3.p1 TRINITY_DN7297_c0_g1~~TRINITY_DN7297_c0_g1_i3.p1  ORF type:complete len:142 (+),score=44.20 TRINITY_DN7297_c0_g1_i3:593-1018(+)
MDIGAYVPYIQDHLVQAQYLRSLDDDDFIKHNIWLPYQLNMKDPNPEFAKRLNDLNKFVFTVFESDSMVEPKISSWFGWCKPNTECAEVVPMNQTEVYQRDLLGLKQMDEDGKFVFLSSPGDHLQFTDAWFVKNIIPYLRE